MIIRIKRYIKKSSVGRWTANKKKEFLERIYYKRKRSPYIATIEKLMENGEGNFSIISYNCFGGRIIQDLGLPYNTPTVGLYFMYPDYIEFLKHLEYYLKDAKIEFVEHSKYPGYDERRERWSHWYPIGLLDGKVEIHFLHYYSEKEAAEKWYRRAKRINWNNLIVFGMEQNLCTDDDIRVFDKLPFERKFFFSTKELTDVTSNCFVEKFAMSNEVGDPYKSGHHFYKALVDNAYKRGLL